MSYLELHKKLLKTGLCDKSSGFDGGLCAHLEDDILFQELFCPKSCDGDEFLYPACYWGYNGFHDLEDLTAGNPSPARYEYTTLRQNMVIFMAAMNNEL